MAIMDDNAEIMFGQMAEKRGPAINTLGVMLVQDHMQARDRADKIAKAEGLALPTQLSSSASQQRLKLEKLSGPQFNYQFVRYIIKDHRRAITAYRREGKKIGPVAGLARSTLPDLEKHLRVALGLVQQGV
jgi:putative membrane protein